MFQENISDLSSIKEKLLSETLPSGFISIVQETQIILLYVVNISADDFSSPQLLASVKVSANLDLNLFVGSKKVSFTVYQHLITSNKLTNISQLLNILALCKALCANSYESDKSSAYLSLALSFLKEYVALGSHNTSSESSLALVKFVVEQLSLVNIPKHKRRYSSSLIITSLTANQFIIVQKVEKFTGFTFNFFSLKTFYGYDSTRWHTTHQVFEKSSSRGA